MPFYKVLYDAGVFLGGEHFQRDEVIEYHPTEDELAKSKKNPPEAILWGIETDEAGNPVDNRSEGRRTGANTPGQRLAKPPADDKPKELSKSQKKAQIKEALTLLDAGNDEHWNADESPKVKAVEDVLGYDIAKEDIEAAQPGFKRPAKA